MCVCVEVVSIEEACAAVDGSVGCVSGMIIVGVVCEEGVRVRFFGGGLNLNLKVVSTMDSFFSLLLIASTKDAGGPEALPPEVSTGAETSGGGSYTNIVSYAHTHYPHKKIFIRTYPYLSTQIRKRKRFKKGCGKKKVQKKWGAADKIFTFFRDFIYFFCP